MTTGYFGPPTPDYNNPPINPQYFQPSRFVISGVLRGPTTTISTTVAHNYVIGQEVRFLIQPTFGMQQLNQQTSFVIAVPTPTTFTVNIDSRLYNPFIPSPSYGPTLPQVVAIGDENSGIISTTGRSVTSTTIPGAFENISPQ